MESELVEIKNFIGEIPPFTRLPENALERVIDLTSITYLRKETDLQAHNRDSKRDGPLLYIVRKGALSYWQIDPSGNNELLGKYGEGDICTVYCISTSSASNKGHSDILVQTEEDTLLYTMAWHELIEVLTHFPKVLAYFDTSASERLQTKVNEIQGDALVNATLLNTEIASFFRQPPITVGEADTIQAAANIMNERNVSSLLVTQDEALVGIVTDKDMRRRCVAEGLDISQPVSAIMSKKLVTIEASNNAFDALLLMTSKSIHHLPVTRSGKLAGMVTITDLMHQEGQNAVHLTGVIHKAESISELANLSKLVPKLQLKMAKMGTTADHLGKSISAIGAAFTARLLELGEKLYGPPPVAYAWLAAGSLARREQCCHSDQDNAIVLSDKALPEHDYYFHDLATFVSDGLAACGYIYCPGDVMATNPKWRQPLKVWHNYFDKWVNQPDPKALMHCSIFFDMQTLYGDTELLNQLRREVLKKTKGNTLFLAHLTRNALNLKPPLGFFRDFVLEKNGDNENTLDLKHKGLAPIVDLARIYALSEGCEEVNTIARLKAVKGSSAITKASADNLIDAFEFIGMLRLTHQVNQLQQGKAVDNYVAPKEISRLEREHLKEAFKVVKGLQEVRQSTYG